MPATVTDRCLMSRELAAAYQLLGVRPDCHDLVLGKARTALLTISTSDRQDAKIEAAYAVIRRSRRAPST
jgi:hypothetical protein